jgi:UbiD family decarboxylase
MGVSPATSRAAMGMECIEREKHPIKPVVISQDEAPVREVVRAGDNCSLYDLPVMRHYYMDGGPYLVMASILRDEASKVYNLSYHRMEVKDPHTMTLYASPRHAWQIFSDFEARGEECPVATVLGHHPAFNMGAAFTGPFETDEYDIIGGYLQQPLRLVPSETWGDRLMVPADAEIVIEGALLPGKRLVDGPFGEAPGYMGPQRFSNAAYYQVRAITRRKDAMMQSIITPEGDKPWLDLPREAAYLRRCKEAVPGVTAVCKGGRMAHYNIFIAMKKRSEGDPGRAAAAALTFDHSKHVFVFDDDIDIYDPTEVLWALATRVQPEKQITILKDLFRGNMLDPSLQHDIRTSAMIVDATRPTNRPFSPVSEVPKDALERIHLEDFFEADALRAIPVDRTSYWA